MLASPCGARTMTLPCGAYGSVALPRVHARCVFESPSVEYPALEDIEGAPVFDGLLEATEKGARCVAREAERR